MKTLYLIDHPEVDITPADCGENFFLRHVAGREAIEIYIELRAKGEDQLGAFIAAFGHAISGKLEDLAASAEAFEKSKLYLSGEQPQISVDTLREEWKARADEMSLLAREHAQAIRVQRAKSAAPLAQFELDDRARIAQRDGERFSAMAMERSTARAKAEERERGDLLMAEGSMARRTAMQRDVFGVY